MLGLVVTAAAAIALIVVAILALAAKRPSSFRVERRLSIRATPERLFALIEDLRAMNTWNPYALRDPHAGGAYSGPASGKGAVFTFAGSKSGTGRIEIVEAIAARRVTMRLSMVKPMRVNNEVTFTLEPKGEATAVTWAMQGTTPLLGRVVGLFLDCDKMVGKDFEMGLANLRALVEGPKMQAEGIAARGAEASIVASERRQEPSFGRAP